MRIRIVDAFTDRPFSGAPAGVLLLDEFPPDAWMQQVAAEVNHAETAFLHPLPPGGDADWALRWFTPAVEVALCGHATLAAAHVLAPAAPVRFATRSGVLTATAGPGGRLTLDFPTAPLSPVPADPALAAALGAEPVSVHHTGPDTDDLLVELADEAAVRSLTPDLRALVPLSRRGVIVTAAAASAATGPAATRDSVATATAPARDSGSPATAPARDSGSGPDGAGGGYDFVSRFFGPAVGVDEDPVTGSAHTALAPFWAARLGRTELVGYQASRRGGSVRVALHGDRTHLSGQAVTVIDGTLNAAAGSPGASRSA
ncbi:PhzF family phenazine biosynthesis protein [Actinoplanes sp. DH11]|uniref:PhzF family phenazine biosynthesis protein n=1 Tax=Actinoplanes sp. DH11 TaxID=2857011 RepID=UPI001E519BFA|nr:PhzF family phenazine biosynthesis protein [Actinoplanes sp. DH11]